MTHRSLTQFAGLLIASLAVSGITQTLQAQVLRRPLSDFLSAQGTGTSDGTNPCWTAPAPTQLGWGTGNGNTNGVANRTPGRFAMIDYTGGAAQYLLTQGINLGTTVSGSVKERPLADGRALVSVDLTTNNALGWAFNYDDMPPIDPINSTPLLIGHRAQDLVANPALQPALGASHFRITFTNTMPNAPLPDLVCINRGAECPFIDPCPVAFEIESINFSANITGPLHPISGLGPEGTPGRLNVSQTGKFDTGNGVPAKDGFPVESIAVTRIGR